MKISLIDIDEIIGNAGRDKKNLIPILQHIQQKYHYLPETALKRISEITDITPAEVVSVVTFYSQFRCRPVGQHLVKVCTGTACHVKGASRIKDAILRFLHIEEGNDSDRKGLFTVKEVACLGCCTLAPVVQIGDVTYGHLTPNNVGEMIEDFIELQKNKKEKGNEIEKISSFEAAGEIRIGLGSCCIAGGSAGVMESLEKEVSDSGCLVRLKKVGCVGMCHQTPLVEVIDREGKSVLYPKVTPDQAHGIVREHFKPASLTKSLGGKLDSMFDQLLSSGSKPKISSYSIDIRDQPVKAFLSKQKHIATANCGNIDPLDIAEYIETSGFKALEKVLNEKKQSKVIDQIVESGLRGRGGAGFPTAEKWKIVSGSLDKQKYIVMNGDEGDPGAFMDRMLLESFPFRIIEGIIIAAFSVGANKGVMYIREEYPLALMRIRDALDTLRRMRYLGENILESGFDFDITIMEGAGAFVCGEETALLESIEGKRGFPRFRPPFPAVSGLWDKPTLINNVETYSCIPWIILESGKEFSALGSEKSKGTKVFSLTGKVARGGLIEVPMGITINEIVNDIGGGVQNGRKFKAVQIGGPSGGCIPAEMGDIPVDFEKLAEAGAIMGSGGLVVLDDSDCMVDVAKYFLEFTQDQSCGKCTFCRVGTKRMLEILSSFCQGNAKKNDIENLLELSENIKKGSLCGLGKTAPNPVLTSIRYFRKEFEAHLDGKCPAGQCPDLIRYYITADCIGCTICAQNCPVDAIKSIPYERHEVIDDKCVKCGACKEGCPANAVKIGNK